MARLFEPPHATSARGTADQRVGFHPLGEELFELLLPPALGP